MRNFEDLYERIDLDNEMKNIVKDYPKNSDDFIFYIRGKNSTKELFMASAGEELNFGIALANIALQNEQIRKQLNLAIDYLEKNKKKH